MRYRRLGNSGLEVSETGLGTNNFGRRMNFKETRAVLDCAIDLGVNLIDTADMYSRGASESYIGRALRGKRGRVALATKFASRTFDGPHGEGGSRMHIVRAIEESLTRLNTDHVDLYQIHFPDPHTPIEETLRALDDLVRSGKVRYVGCSNFAPWQIADAAWVSRINSLPGFVSAQPEYSMLHRDGEADLLAVCSKYGLGILPYRPLAHGFLTGKYRRGEPPQPGLRLDGDEAARERRLTDTNFDLLDRLAAFAAERDRSLTDLAFAWLLAHPQVGSVIAGASNPEQMSQNAAASGWQLTADERDELDGILG